MLGKGTLLPFLLDILAESSMGVILPKLNAVPSVEYPGTGGSRGRAGVSGLPQRLLRDPFPREGNGSSVQPCPCTRIASCTGTGKQKQPTIGVRSKILSLVQHEAEVTPAKSQYREACGRKAPWSGCAQRAPPGAIARTCATLSVEKSPGSLRLTSLRPP